jgi:beta-ureidopropionase
MKVKCAIVQVNFSVDKDENVTTLCDAVREAGKNGARIICLPELATTEYFCVGMHEEFLDYAEPIPGPSTEKVGAAAKDAGVYVLFPLYEKVKDGELYNSAAFIDPGGEIAGLYRKIHIPLVKAKDMHGNVVEGNEKFYFRPGNLGYPVWDTSLGVKVGTTICYDRHFPEGPRCLALNGADIILIPVATPLGGEMWEIELRGHAIANLCWVAAANRVGRDRNGHFELNFYGRSLWAAPDGELVAAAGTEGDEILYCEIDTDRSKELRDAWGFFRDRRPEAYAEVTAP